MKLTTAVLSPLAAGVLLAALPTATALVPRTAGACSLAGNDDHHLDPAHASDTTPPSPATASADLVWHEDDDGGGCGSTVASCGSYGLITLTVAATDDAAAADDLGYQLRLVGGVPPSGLNLPAQNVRTFSGELLVYFDYSSPGFDFDLEIRAVDLNGNLGPPSPASRGRTQLSQLSCASPRRVVRRPSGASRGRTQLSQLSCASPRRVVRRPSGDGHNFHNFRAQVREASCGDRKL